MDNGWNNVSQTKSKAQSQKRRVFISGLRFSSKLEDKLRELFSKSAIAIRGNVHIDFPKHLQQGHTESSGGIGGSTCFAFVECDTEMAVNCLNGMMFDGNFLTVKLEKKQSKGRQHVKKFGGGWTKPQISRPVPDGKQSLLSTSAEMLNPIIKNDASSAMNHTVPLEGSCELLSEEINELVSDALKETSESDGLNAAIASTTAVVALLSAKFAGSDAVKSEQSKIEDKETVSNSNSDDVSAFHSKCKSSFSRIMDDYGEYDANFEQKNMQTKKGSPASSTHATVSTKQDKIKGNTSNQINDLNGMLAPNGKAPIHIQLVSFGYKYSVPPQAREGWSHSNPLSPMDCRDLPRAPHFVAKLSGLSFKVKQALLRECHNKTNTEDDTISDSAPIVEKENPPKKPNQLKLKAEDIAVNVLKAIEEAIRDGGHGYAFPLEITVYIGSEYGRHRSVVLCEIAAQTIRGMLRKMTDNTISDPVSVGTRHRDVDNNHQDGEAFGKDLKKEHEAETRRKKKQEWLEDRY